MLKSPSKTVRIYTCQLPWHVGFFSISLTIHTDALVGPPGFCEFHLMSQSFSSCESAAASIEGETAQRRKLRALT